MTEPHTGAPAACSKGAFGREGGLGTPTFPNAPGEGPFHPSGPAATSDKPSHPSTHTATVGWLQAGGRGHRSGLPLLPVSGSAFFRPTKKQLSHSITRALNGAAVSAVLFEGRDTREESRDELTVELALVGCAGTLEGHVPETSDPVARPLQAACQSRIFLLLLLI